MTTSHLAAEERGGQVGAAYLPSSGSSAIQARLGKLRKFRVRSLFLSQRLLENVGKSLRPSSRAQAISEPYRVIS